MAKTGEKGKEHTAKLETPTKRTCQKCGLVINAGEMFPIKDGMRRKMMYFHRKCAAEMYKLTG